MSSALNEPGDDQAVAAGLLSLVAVPRLRVGVEVDRSRMRKEELVLLDLVDGKRKVAEILQEGRLSGFVAMRILRSLYLRNILEPGDLDGAAGGGGAAPSSVTIAADIDTPKRAARPPRVTAMMGLPDAIKALGAGPVATPSGKRTERTLAIDPALTKRLVSERTSAPVEAKPAPTDGATKSESAQGDGKNDSKTDSAKPDSKTAAAASEAAPAQVGPPPAAPVVDEETRANPVAADGLPIAPSADKGASAPPASAEPGAKSEPAATAKAEPAAAASAAATESAAAETAKATDASAAPEAPLSSSESSAIRGDTARPFQVGPYDVAARIAQGGMGSIYVCRRRGPWGFERLFTLKVVRQHAAVAEEAVRSFLREAKLGATLSHPNLLSVLDAGSFDGHPYLILDYVEGASVAELMAGERPSPDLIVPVLLDLLAGLQALHTHVGRDGAAMNMVHGDVSPENVLVGLDGSARLGDFGSARPAGPNPDGAQTAAKPAFMAPEQLCGEPTDQRTDLFSVGVILWTALTGQKLFGDPSYEQTVMNVLRKKIPAPSTLGAPVAFDEVCFRALSRAPEARYQSADDMRAALLKAGAAAGLIATPAAVGAWVRRVVGETISDRRRRIFRALAAEPAPRTTLTPAPARKQEATIANLPLPPKRRAVRPTIELRGGGPFVPSSAPAPVTVADEEVPIMERGGRWRWMWMLAVLLAAGLGALAWAAWRAAATDQRSTPVALPSGPS